MILDKLLNFLKKNRKTETTRLKNAKIQDFKQDSKIKYEHKHKKSDAELKDLQNQIQTQQAEIITNFNPLLKEIINKLNLQVEILQNVDISKKESEERLKNLSKNGVKDFSNQVLEFCQELSLVETKNLKLFHNIIKTKIVEFQKKSFKSYDKASILVGKELAAIVKTISQLSKQLEKLYSENKKLIELDETFSSINELNSEKKKLFEEKNVFITELKKFETEKKILEEEINSLKKEEENYKNSKEYKTIKELEDKIKNKDSNVKNLIQKLKQTINFKDLAKKFHSNKKDMEIIKEYRNNFEQAFLSDFGEKIADLIEINPELNHKIKTLILEKQELLKKLSNFNILNSLKDFENKITSNKEKILDINKKILKFKEKIKEKNKELTRINENLNLEEQKIF